MPQHDHESTLKTISSPESLGNPNPSQSRLLYNSNSSNSHEEFSMHDEVNELDLPIAQWKG
ncbi:hypothetical protein TorRG33x02_184350, partial [Trema orientale]